jgi:hypothetical protein
MPQCPIVLPHGCRDRAKALRPSRVILIERRCTPAAIELRRFVSFGNELTGKELAVCVC